MNVINYITSLIPEALADRAEQLRGDKGDEGISIVTRRKAWNGFNGLELAVSYVPNGTHRVDREQGLIVSGMPIDTFTGYSFEANYIRLLTGRHFIGEEALLWELSLDLRERMFRTAREFIVSKEFKSIYLMLTSMRDVASVHPLDMVCAAVLTMEGHSRVQKKLQSDQQQLISPEDVLKDFVDLQGFLLVIVPLVWRIFSRKTIGDIAEPELESSYARQLAVYFGIAEDQLETAESVLNTLLYLMAYHGPGNVSTFVGTLTTSVLTNPFGSFVAMSKALKGVNHGGAAEMGTRILFSLSDRFYDTSTDRDLFDFARKRIQSGASGYCVGHRILSGRDPRERLQLEMLEHEFPESDVLALARHWYQQLAPAVRDVCGGEIRVVNVDAYTGVSLIELGIITSPEQAGFATVLSQVSRACGLATESFWSYLSADKNGVARVKPVLIRPSAVKR